MRPGTADVDAADCAAVYIVYFGDCFLVNPLFQQIFYFENCGGGKFMSRRVLPSKSWHQTHGYAAAGILLWSNPLQIARSIILLGRVYVIHL